MTNVIWHSLVKMTLECPVPVLGPWITKRLGKPLAHVPERKKLTQYIARYH